MRASDAAVVVGVLHILVQSAVRTHDQRRRALTLVGNHGECGTVMSFAAALLALVSHESHGVACHARLSRRVRCYSLTRVELGRSEATRPAARFRKIFST